MTHCEIIKDIYFQSVEIKSCEFGNSAPKSNRSKINLENSEVGGFSFSCDKTIELPYDQKKVVITSKSQTAPRTNITDVPFHVELKCNNSTFPILKIERNSAIDLELKNCDVHDFSISNTETQSTKKGSEYKVTMLQCTFKNDVDLKKLPISELSLVNINLSYSKIGKKLSLPKLTANEQEDTKASNLILAYTECDILEDSESCWPRLSQKKNTQYRIYLQGFRYNYLKTPKFPQSDVRSCDKSQRPILINFLNKMTKTPKIFCSALWGFSNANLGSRIEIMLKNQDVLHSTDALSLLDADASSSEARGKELTHSDEEFNAFGWHILQTALSNMGMAPEAQDLAIKRRLSARTNASITEKLTSVIFEISANFGYNPFRAVLWFFVLLALLTFISCLGSYLALEQIFISNSCSNALQVSFDKINHEALSLLEINCTPIKIWEILGYSFDWLIPIIDFGFESKWSINRAASFSTLATWVFLLFRFVGAYVVAITLISFSGYLNQDR